MRAVISEQRMILVVALLLTSVAAVVLFWRFRVGGSVTHEGRSVREWVVLLDSHVDHKQQNDEARQAFMKLGPRAVPELHRILAARKSPRIDWFRGLAIRMKLVRPQTIQLYELKLRATTAAAVVAEETGADIHHLVPHLAFHFTNGYAFHGWANRTLASAGPDGISVLTNLLFVGEPAVRDQAAWALANWSPKAPQSSEALLRAAKLETNEVVRADVLLYLRNLRLPADAVLPLAAGSLQNTNAYTRWTAVELLSKHRTNHVVIELLSSMTNDSDQRVRTTALRAFTR